MISDCSEDDLNKRLVFKSLFIGLTVKIIKTCLIFSGENYDSQ